MSVFLTHKSKIIIIVFLVIISLTAYSQKHETIEFPVNICKQSFKSAADYSIAVALAFTRKDIDCINSLLHRNYKLSQSFVEDSRLRFLNYNWEKTINEKLNSLAISNPIKKSPNAIFVRTRELKKIKLPLKQGSETVPFEERVSVYLFYKNDVYYLEIHDIAKLPSLGWVSCSPNSFSMYKKNVDSKVFFKECEDYVKRPGSKNMYILRKGK